MSPVLRTPRYRDACLTDILPAAVDVVRPPEGDRPVSDRGLRRLLPEGTTAVVVLVLDGLGRHLLDAHAAVAPTLAAATGTTIDACFPTTTATNLTALGTGVPAALHGITASSIPLLDAGHLLMTLSWRFDHQFDGPDAREVIRPERFQPVPTVLSTAPFQGVAGVTVLRPEFATSGLTRAALRGAEVITASDLEGSLTAALDVTRRRDRRPTVVYVHHGDIDAAGHLQGPGSEFWCEHLAAADAAVAAAAEQRPDDVALVVTADHGMVGVPPEGFIELADQPELLAGVVGLGGDPRARQVMVEPGAARDVHAAWTELAGDRAEVRLRDEAVMAGWFGDQPPSPRVAARIGDVIAVARDDIAWVHRDLDAFGGRLVGQHASLTDAELEVPLLVL